MRYNFYRNCCPKYSTNRLEGKRDSKCYLAFGVLCLFESSVYASNDARSVEQRYFAKQPMLLRRYNFFSNHLYFFL